MASPLQDCIVLFVSLALLVYRHGTVTALKADVEGDSITNRQDVPGTLQTLMCEAYRRHLDVLNRGFGGYNTTIARPLLEKIFAPKSASGAAQVRLVTIWFGANDAVLPGKGGEQHVDLETYRANLEYFLESLTSATSPLAVAHQPVSIVLITPPPVDEATLGSFGGAVRKQDVVQQYADVVLDLGRKWSAKGKEGSGKWRVESVDMCSAVLAAAKQDGQLSSYFTDGLHLSSKGYNVFWQEYCKLVKGPLKGRGLDWEDPPDCPPRVPIIEDVDFSDPNSVIEGMKHAPFHSS